MKIILRRYPVWIWSLIAPFGPWGVFAIAAVDAAFMGLPLDAVLVGYVYRAPRNLLWYVLLASIGSALGSTFLYLLGYVGGEKVLAKRISEVHYAKIRGSFERHEFWALMLPAMLPPPTPFKLFVLTAASFEMRYTRFLSAIFAGRFVRFFVLSVLTFKFGAQFVRLAGDLGRHHLGLLLAVAMGLVLCLALSRKATSARTIPADAAQSMN